MSTVSKALLTLTFLWNLCALGQQPKPLLPDPKLTPRDVFDVIVQDICTPGYSKKVRAVTAKPKRQAYAEYGITSPNPGDYQLNLIRTWRESKRASTRGVSLCEFWQDFDLLCAPECRNCKKGINKLRATKIQAIVAICFDGTTAHVRFLACSRKVEAQG